MAPGKNPFKQAVRDLTKAREILTPRKMWIQNEYDDGERVCAIGALARAQNKLSVFTQYQENCALEFLEKALPRGYYAVPAYNDARRRRHSDILKLFDRAIAAAQQAAKSKIEKA